MGRARYIVVMAAAKLLDPFERHLRDGAVLARAKVAACKESAAPYGNTR